MRQNAIHGSITFLNIFMQKLSRMPSDLSPTTPLTKENGLPEHPDHTAW